MTSNNKSFLPDSFLNTARVNHIPVTLFLVNGGIQHLIYKSAISTIVPQRTVNYHPNREEGNGSEENE